MRAQRRARGSRCRALGDGPLSLEVEGDGLRLIPEAGALLDGRPAYAPGSIDFVDRDGRPLDLQQSFRLDDDPEDMAHFLAEAGFLHLAGVFERDEMDAISAEIDAALPEYSPEDGRSWWVRTSGGEHRPVRLQGFQRHSAGTRELLADPRFLRIGELTGAAASSGSWPARTAPRFRPVGSTPGSICRASRCRHGPGTPRSTSAARCT